MNNIIEFNNVTYNYSSEDADYIVLKDFNLNIKKGSFTVILGHNGSGKSTLAKLMNGLYKPQSGSVLVNGINTLDEELDLKVKSTVGMVFQNPDNQIVASVVEEDVAFGPENLGLPQEEIRQRVDSALKTVNMYEHKNDMPHKLSGGQKQRIAIAGVIAMLPECIVLDEPTAMLDPKGRQDVIDTIYKLNKEHGITIVLITHFMEQAKYADRVLVLNNGEITADGTPIEVFSKPEFLKNSGLDIPQTTELIFELAKKGLNFKNGIISVDDTANAIAAALRK
ncbi:MAG: energy-coupling factor transporter ATPase [Clostridia bacterium]|nr:energy-coupling factor transporter ATPase [Clostridia bacterium]